ncbi:hypothetical protein HYH03_007456 [Edaphochlamys debaryana]|uniref:Uncharacterized protein n=1 Tax=Edaphochlamys debaryana TaxID=47281 RepID=A0A835YBB2_9CHLO|nr:hypothetical protein HYH03_007456 [Edaphochlamys debaryana]|eukprot:KAG2494404.1 hypothetical protein HYH03_007456 [Edaphochlamys debaryana]
MNGSFDSLRAFLSPGRRCEAAGELLRGGALALPPAEPEAAARGSPAGSSPLLPSLAPPVVSADPAEEQRRACDLTPQCGPSAVSAEARDNGLADLPCALLQRILVAAGTGAGGAVRGCKALRESWRAALRDPALAAHVLVTRHGPARAPLHVYACLRCLAGGGGPAGSLTAAGAVGPLLTLAAPPHRRAQAALELVQALAAQRAGLWLATTPGGPPVSSAAMAEHRALAPGFLAGGLLLVGPEEVVTALMAGASGCGHLGVVKALLAGGAAPSAVAAGLVASARAAHVEIARELLAAQGHHLPPPAASPPPGDGSAADAADRAAAAVAPALPAVVPQPPPPLPHHPHAAALLAAPLTAAAAGRSGRHLALLALLLSLGADPRTHGGEALAAAAAAGSTAGVELLLAAGAEPTANGCRALVAAAEVLRVGCVWSLLKTRAFGPSEIGAVARQLLMPPLVGRVAAVAALLLPWLAAGALLLLAAAPLVMGCVLVCLWNGLWLVSSLAVVGYGLGLAAAAAAVGLAAGMTLAAAATSALLTARFLLRALLRRTAADRQGLMEAAAAMQGLAGGGVAGAGEQAGAQPPEEPPPDLAPPLLQAEPAPVAPADGEAQPPELPALQPPPDE